MDTSKATELLWNLLSYIDLSSVSEAFAKYLKYLPLFAIGAISSLILTPIVGYIANKYDITYKPGVKRLGKEYDNKEKAMHEGITPSLGGLAITIPVILAILLFFKLDSFSIPLLVSILILVIGATLDDVFNLPAKTQLLYQLLASIVLAFSIIDLTNLSIINLPLDAFTWEFSVLGLQQSFVFPGDLIMIFWIVACINAFKWTAGSPGIIEGNSIIIFLLIFIIGTRFESVFSSTISILITGGMIIFFVFALPPQKIMTGSAGKSVYGFLICLLSLVAEAKLSTSLILLIVPLLDFAYVIIKRYLTYKPKSFTELMKINGPDHFHHQLIKLGLTRTQVVLVEIAITLFLGSFAILTAGAVRYFVIVLVIALGIAILVYTNIRASKKQIKEEKEESPESKYSY
ncbi:MAG TPA: MraY family glycosyltransferase [Candidatus Dojkabacteria bacterium]|jgi:UDP-GlcNAc:undecaprenyl-phosphate GlcNAc-1-phosphate transferase|nr:MraY family glycosyltransferase [Candidatus Dojkabacteria bacterium]